MTILNTPSAQFQNLPGYDFEPHFTDLGDGLSMHYVDEGEKDLPVVLLLHGEPSWSYLYRKMIPVFVQENFRVLAPDLIGFGKSSKPTDTEDYTYARHLEWCSTWLERLDLTKVHLFAQDWGGLIGLRLVAKYLDRFASVTVGNTGLPTGDHPMPDAFTMWQQYSKQVDVLPIGKILQKSTVNRLDDEIIRAYEAPFPDASFQAGAKIFPSLVPTKPDDPESENNRKAWKLLAGSDIPVLTVFSDSDPITKGGEKPFQKLLPGAKGRPHQIIKGAGHFLQEDKGEEIAHVMINFIRSL